jgi:hypothetical protein
MKKEKDSLPEPAYEESQLKNIANQMGITTEQMKLDGTRHFLECLAELHHLQNKIIRHTKPGTLARDLSSRKDMVDLMLRATSWLMERGPEGNEDNWDNKTYFIQKLEPVLHAYGYELKEIPPSNLDDFELSDLLE